MSTNHKFRQDRDALRAELGERCAKCSTTQDLEFDCIEPTGPEHHGKSLADRMNYYVRQFAKGNLQLLCRHCHNKKSIEDTKRIARAKELAFLEQAHKENQQFLEDLAPGPHSVRRIGPEPPATDWDAWCRWHRGEDPYPETK